MRSILLHLLLYSRMGNFVLILSHFVLDSVSFLKFANGARTKRRALCVAKTTYRITPIGCEKEFYSRADCYAGCNNKEPCKLACRHHETMSRQKIDIDELRTNLTRNVPHDIYEEADKRNHSTISVSCATNSSKLWGHCGNCENVYIGHR